MPPRPLAEAMAWLLLDAGRWLERTATAPAATLAADPQTTIFDHLEVD